MEEFDFEKRKRREQATNKALGIVIILCIITLPIMELWDAQNNVNILQYGEKTIGVVYEKRYDNSKYSGGLYLMYYTCIIDSVIHNMMEQIVEEEYLRVQVGQAYTVRYLPGKRPWENALLVFSEPIYTRDEEYCRK